jgi:SAM-dependent methyltransferase
MSSLNIPMPPPELRILAGPTDPSEFDNPKGMPICGSLLPPSAYEVVFDFGCGCGRLARKLLQQKPRPRRYLGIDIHRGMLEWCRNNLSPVEPSFQFLHHDVYSPSYAPGNSLRLAQPFPCEEGEFTLLFACSVFTHLCRQQAEYYLGEVARVLAPQGVALTTWFFFDRESFPFFREGPYSLYTSAEDFAQAVVFDRGWFLDTVRRVGLGVQATTPPGVAGHQWTVLLKKRTPDATDQFPLGEEAAEWLCGATRRPIAAPVWSAQAIAASKVSPEGERAAENAQAALERPRPPALFGALAELDAARREVDVLRRQLWFTAGAS